MFPHSVFVCLSVTIVCLLDFCLFVFASICFAFVFVVCLVVFDSFYWVCLFIFYLEGGLEVSGKYECFSLNSF